MWTQTRCSYPNYALVALGVWFGILLTSMNDRMQTNTLSKNILDVKNLLDVFDSFTTTSALWSSSLANPGSVSWNVGRIPYERCLGRMSRCPSKGVWVSVQGAWVSGQDVRQGCPDVRARMCGCLDQGTLVSGQNVWMSRQGCLDA